MSNDVERIWVVSTVEGEKVECVEGEALRPDLIEAQKTLTEPGSQPSRVELQAGDIIFEYSDGRREALPPESIGWTRERVFDVLFKTFN